MSVYQAISPHEYGKMRKYLWYILRLEHYPEYMCHMFDVRNERDKRLLINFKNHFDAFFPIRYNEFVGIRATLLMLQPNLDRGELLHASKIIEKVVAIAQISVKLNNRIFTRGDYDE